MRVVPSLRDVFQAATAALTSSVIAAALVSGCGSPEPAGPMPPTPVVPPDAAAVTRGHEAFSRYCALCHGEHAEGYAADNAPALGNPDFLRVATDEFLRIAIEEGHAGTPMSAWHQRAGGPLDDATIAEIIAFLRSHAEGPPVDTAGSSVRGDREHGATLFAEHCAECHGDEGQGVNATSLDSEVFLRTATDGFVRETIARGRRGTPMHGWDDRLASSDIDDLTTFVRSLSPRTLPPEPPMGPPPPGLDDLVLNPDGTNAAFVAREDRFVPGVDVLHAMENHERFILLDARASSDWATAHIPGAAPFPFYEASELVGHITDPNIWVIAYCACPHGASGHVVDELRAAGHVRSAILDEGIGWWIEQGYPTQRGTLP